MRYREGFLQTHPPTAERIERLQGLTREAER
jgi:Zn-dependent protease with chaperone function